MSTQPHWETMATENGHVNTNTSTTIDDCINIVVEFIISKLLVSNFTAVPRWSVQHILLIISDQDKTRPKRMGRCPRSKEAREARGAPKAVESRVTLMVAETDPAMQGMDIYGGQQDRIQQSSKEVKKDVTNMYSLQVMKINKQPSSQGQ